jgi:hypothetical protein
VADAGAAGSLRCRGVAAAWDRGDAEGVVGERDDKWGRHVIGWANGVWAGAGWAGGMLDRARLIGLRPISLGWAGHATLALGLGFSWVFGLDLEQNWAGPDLG